MSKFTSLFEIYINNVMGVYFFETGSEYDKCENAYILHWQ